MSEENKAVELKEEDLEKVTGGETIYINYLAGISFTENVSTNTAYCKYCKADRTLVFVGAGYGYEGCNRLQCNLWRCQVCNCDSYIDLGSGRLL